VRKELWILLTARPGPAPGGDTPAVIVVIPYAHRCPVAVPCDPPQATTAGRMQQPRTH